MSLTITRSYETYEDAQRVVENLEAEGVYSEDIAIIGHQKSESRTTEGAAVGAGLGGAAGLLAGLGSIAIPGIGPVMAAGWLATTTAGAVAGAMAGGIVGSLTSAGVSEEDAHYHAETVRRGGSVVSVRAEDEHIAPIEAIMDGASPIDREERLAAYRNEGWTKFEEAAPPYPGKV